MPRPMLSPFSVADCVGEALANNPLPEGVRVETDFPPSLPPALGDAEQVRIVFANLIRNARDAMSAGGRLTIHGRPADGMVEVTFEDTGVGIPAENLSRLTEPLYSTKARGLGLGLAIAKAILDKHGGTLRAASSAGQGSTFTVRLAVPGADDGRQPSTTKEGVT
jgi:two-component system sensor kinase FixL